MGDVSQLSSSINSNIHSKEIGVVDGDSRMDGAFGGFGAFGAFGVIDLKLNFNNYIDE